MEKNRELQEKYAKERGLEYAERVKKEVRLIKINHSIHVYL